MGGNKLVSKEIWNVPFYDGPENGKHRESGVPEHADKKIIGELASYCTNDNVQDYTLTGRKTQEPVYAMVIISSVQEVSGITTYMVDKVNTRIIDGNNISSVRRLLRKLARIAHVSESPAKVNKKPNWLPNQTPPVVPRKHDVCQHRPLMINWHRLLGVVQMHHR